MTETVTLHPSILRLAKAMQSKIERDEHKGPWRDQPSCEHLQCLLHEVWELTDAPRGFWLQEAADVANFALFYCESREREESDSPER